MQDLRNTATVSLFGGITTSVQQPTSRLGRPSFLSLAALLVACAGELPTTPQSPQASASLASMSASATRSAGGRCTTAFIAGAPVAGLLPLEITGVCQIRHLGRTTMTATQTVSLIDGSAQNLTTYTAANGDKLYTRWDGQVVSPPGPDIVFVGTETYLGGTGRFAGASGSSWLEGTAYLAGPTGTGEYTAKGSITF
jgi:hypothetical protein